MATYRIELGVADETTDEAETILSTICAELRGRLESAGVPVDSIALRDETGMFERY